MTAVPERRSLRYVLAGVVAADAVAIAVGTQQASKDAGRQGGHGDGLLVASAPCLFLLAGTGLGALVLFVRRRSPIAAGLVTLAALSVLESAKAAITVAGHTRIFFAGGAALAGWIFGLAFARQVR